MMVSMNGKPNLDFHMDFIHRTIESPSVKTKTVSVPFSDSEIDLAEVDGNIYYGNRKITMQFELRDFRSVWMYRFTQLRNEFHGKIVKVIFWDDPEYYFEGRAAVNEPSDNGSTCTIEIVVDAFPYKKTVEKAEIVRNITTSSASKLFVFDVDNSVAFVTIETTAQIKMVFPDGDSFNIYPNTVNKFYGRKFLRGTHTVTAETSGTPTVTLKFEGGEL